MLEVLLLCLTLAKTVSNKVRSTKFLIKLVPLGDDLILDSTKEILLVM